MSPGRVIGGVMSLFVAGLLCGVAGTSVYHTYEREPHRDGGAAAQHERIMSRLTHELGLTAQQRADIEPIVMRTHVAILELRFAHQAELEEILSDGLANLKGHLSREQQTDLDQLYAGLQQRWTNSRNYLAATKKRMTWLVPSHLWQNGESPKHTNLPTDARDERRKHARWCDPRDPGPGLKACVVSIRL
jgi:uncharacterized coiled-coil protein SlyX